MVSYKGSSVLRQDPKDAWRVMGSAKFTANSQELKQWCLDIHDKWINNKKEGRVDTSFGNEGKNEEIAESNPGSNSDEQDPTANTKMIT